MYIYIYLLNKGLIRHITSNIMVNDKQLRSVTITQLRPVCIAKLTLDLHELPNLGLYKLQLIRLIIQVISITCSVSCNINS